MKKNYKKWQISEKMSLKVIKKDERLIPPWSHPMVLNIGPLDRESSTLTTRPLLLKLLQGISHNAQYPAEFWFNLLQIIILYWSSAEEETENMTLLLFADLEEIIWLNYHWFCWVEATSVKKGSPLWVDTHFYLHSHNSAFFSVYQN